MPPPYLRWRCRRGQLELDLLLNKFLDHPQGYAALSADMRQMFNVLLNYPDTLLLAWLLSQRPAYNALLQNVINHIRRAAAD